MADRRSCSRAREVEPRAFDIIRESDEESDILCLLIADDDGVAVAAFANTHYGRRGHLHAASHWRDVPPGGWRICIDGVPCGYAEPDAGVGGDAGASVTGSAG